ncbi:MAG: carboxyvinyl-carboxyphosphonate phosphorylmutase [Streptosporangiales bacterium]|nr:carboxyvinyl-carboxyphosphonate phosphorylmutase [Streptosporangiales bacterium]
MTAATHAARLRELIAAPETLVAPGAQDALSALLVERAGFDAVFVGDYNASAVLLGRPDYGLVTTPEMVRLVDIITATVGTPLIADAGCGFGNALNVTRAVEMYERAGAAAITIEDQVFPKRCGHMEDKQVVPVEEMAKKIEAAVRARRDPDFVVVARTDSIYTGGMAEAVARGKVFAEAGADVFWADAVPTLDDLARLVREVPLPVQVAMIEGGKTPHSTTAQLQEIGVAIELCGLTTLYAAAGGMAAALSALRRDGITRATLDQMITFDEFNRLVGLPEMQRLERELG